MGERSFVLVPMRTFAAGCLIQAVERLPKSGLLQEDL